MPPRSSRSGLRGDTELRAALREIGVAVGGRQLDKIAGEALEPMREEWSERAKPRRQKKTPNGKHLDQGFVVRRQKVYSPLKREFWLAAKGRAARIAHLVEFGTAPHDQPRRGIKHPGARPFPFARPGFEAKKDEVVGTMGSDIWDRISAASRKLPK